jgi:hypothetical protein
MPCSFESQVDTIVTDAIEDSVQLYLNISQTVDNILSDSDISNFSDSDDDTFTSETTDDDSDDDFESDGDDITNEPETSDFIYKQCLDYNIHQMCQNVFVSEIMKAY